VRICPICRDWAGEFDFLLHYGHHPECPVHLLEATREDLKAAQRVVLSLAARVVAQSEILARRAEKPEQTRNRD
jgi:hypothetical protein